MTRAALGWSAAALLLALACAGPRVAEAPLRIAELEGGDAARRASLRLVVEGLDADVEGQARLALGHYERALQVDPGNPLAYLALARHALEHGDPARALEALDQAELLLESQGERSESVEPHLIGLRGGAAAAEGRASEAAVLLANADALAPSVWGDGRLDADELR
jgi:tetratricopeptide (TPR) repeat protein